MYVHIYSFLHSLSLPGRFLKYFILQSSLHKRQKNCNLRGLFLETVIKKEACFYDCVGVCVCECDFYNHGHIYI